MDIKDVNVNNIKDLTEEDHDRIMRQGLRNIASFMMLKLAVFAALGAITKTLVHRAEMKK